MSVKGWKKPLYGLAGVGAALTAFTSWAEGVRFNLQPPVTPGAEEIFGLHMMMFWICVGIAVVVFGAMFYSMYAHRKSRGAVPAEFHENTTLEFLWTIVPFAILVIVAIPATRTLLNLEHVGKTDMTVKVTGMQWKWKYEYDGQGVSFISSIDPTQKQASLEGKDVRKFDHYLLTVDHPLVLPIKTRIRFLITGADVIHSWWMPTFGIKKDAIPGYVNETWTEIEKPGTYRGQCAELCGQDHAFMPIVVKAVPQKEFETWLAKKKAEAAAAEAQASSNKVWSKDELMAKGKEIFHGKGGCFGCHGMNGEGVGTFPALKGSKIATGPVPAHIHRVLFGKPGTPMPAFKDQLNDLEIAAVVTYERNAFGNNTGDVVQPADIKAAR